MSSTPEISEAEIRERCSALLSAAFEEVTRLHHNYIGTEHLFNAITRAEQGLTHRLLTAAGLDPRVVRNEVRREVGPGDDEDTNPQPPLTPRAYRVLAMATYYADDYNADVVGEAHLLLALLQEGDGVAARKLQSMHVDLNRWIEILIAELDKSLPGIPQFIRDDTMTGQSAFGFPADLNLSDETMPHPASRTPTPLLDKFGRDLTEQARRGKIGPAIGREREIRAVARTLARNRKNNPLLIGDAGVGKTAVVEGLAHAIVQGYAPPSLSGKRIIQLEIGTLVAGTSLRGQFEERLIGIVEEARTTLDIILFIDEIHTIVGAGDTIESNLDAANILKPALSRGDIACIGATTYEEYRKAIAQDSALDRRFHTVVIDEPSPADTLLILENAQARYELHHKVTITSEALKAALVLSTRYMINRRQPDKALDLVDEACARIVIQTYSQPDLARLVDVTAITEILTEWTGIPISELGANDRLKFANMQEALQKRVIGQDHAVRAVSEAIQSNRAGLSDPNRPVGVFLFLGPSGVGKTELAKALAAFLFGSEDALIRLDMSEFYGEHTSARLVGSPPGYKDSQRGGQLTEALNRRPYSVVLLDEIEKATPEVFDLFLQVFDDGRLTDGRGMTVDARHAVWIMTGNVGTAETSRVSLGFRTDVVRMPLYDQHIKRVFRPEFLNRLDEIVIFDPLDDSSLNTILDLRLAELYQRLAEQQINLQLELDARALLINAGTDPANGARPLRRAVERLLIRPLSRKLLADFCAPGGTVIVSVYDERLTFTARQPVVNGAT